MTAYYLRDRTTLTYRRQFFSTEPVQYPTRQRAERARHPGEEIVALTSNPTRALFGPGHTPVQRRRAVRPDGACCENETRTFDGGCSNCGDPCI